MMCADIAVLGGEGLSSCNVALASSMTKCCTVIEGCLVQAKLLLSFVSISLYTYMLNL